MEERNQSYGRFRPQRELLEDLGRIQLLVGEAYFYVGQGIRRHSSSIEELMRQIRVTASKPIKLSEEEL